MYAIIDTAKLFRDFGEYTQSIAPRGMIFTMPLSEHAEKLPYIVTTMPPDVSFTPSTRSLFAENLAGANSMLGDGEHVGLVKILVTPSHVNYQLITYATYGRVRSNGELPQRRMALLADSDPIVQVLDASTVLELCNREIDISHVVDGVSHLYRRPDTQFDRVALTNLHERIKNTRVNDTIKRVVRDAYNHYIQEQEA